ncbi:Leucine rich repeat-containing protein [Pedobacter steynii]|uniref:Leucine rich repeat-containing protein n=1 Tax=Pedobacter steynii TaxID=430522 RepID=A0A1G9K1M2_9SPHI|nr:leucine-rich repeat domain-containing protein [Pedobacter steynii]NQX38417.1 leucine-rich repeat domain-containing protein [Pedobacter steynii]SDL43572.1 Leucine rich repeat-containing protein [Pedobacter steynii]
MSKKKTPKDSQEGYVIAEERIEHFKASSKLRALNLSKLKLEKLPPQLFDIENIRDLFLSSNYLKDLPEEIAKLHSLRILNIQNNQFSTFPEVLLKMDKLTILNLSKNNIDEIPDDIARLSELKQLSLRANKIKAIPETIGKMVNLQHLELADNELKELPREIGYLGNLKNISLSGNPFVFPSSSTVQGILPENNGMFQLLHYFINNPPANIDNDITTRIELPAQLKVAFHQYLTYFNIYVYNLSGVRISSEIVEDELGLSIKVPQADIDYYKKYLIVFMDFIQNKAEDINPRFEREMNGHEKELAILELRTQVRHMQTQIEIKNMETKILKEHVNDLVSLLSLEKSHPQPILIQTTSTSSANSSARAMAQSYVDFKVDFPVLQNELLKFKEEIFKHLNEEQKKELEIIDAELLDIDENIESPEAIKKAPFKRVKRIIEQINDPDSDWAKTISASKKGLDFLQSMGRSYNKIAPWLVLPSIPEVFVGNKK